VQLEGWGEILTPSFFWKGLVGLKEVIVGGIKKHQAGDVEGALQVYDAVLGKVITEPYTLHCVGTLLIDKKLNGVAAQMLMRCIETSPQNAPWMAETYMNLGVALRQEAHEEEAMACYRRSLELKPNDAVTWANYSGCFVNYGRPEKCIEFADKALSIDPNNIQAKHHRALALLEMEKYEAGFKQYEARLDLPEFHRRKYDGIRWNGEKTGTLVIHGEQGLGDEVMFLSLMDRVKERCDRVVVECNHRMITLFERSFGVKCYPGEKEVKENEKTDAWIAMGSLPRVFGIKAPITHSGFLKADPKIVEKYKGDGFRVGLAWRGGTKKTHEHLRNFQIEEWKKILDPRFKWVSLQYGNTGNELQEMGLIDPGWAGFDMDEFAGLVESCDHIVTVCNTTVHVAGALNKPCWVLVPSKPAWRYGSTSERMLWYPSVKMYRQGKDEPWSAVIERVRKDLESLSR
jgi:tetratricopeptide (TPR) repeat protein